MRTFSFLHRFIADTKGNIAILFGLGVIPVVGAMGVALDYSWANASRTQMQAALDNTGLMLAKMMPLSDADLSNKGWQIFQANMGTTVLQYQQSNLAITKVGSNAISLNIDTTYNLQLASVLKVAGIGTSFPVNSHTQVTWGNTRLRVALVLDNTGSMAQATPTKMSALISASKTLIDKFATLEKTPGDGSVYVSLVPFAPSVNVDPTNYGQAWVDFTEWDKTHGTCSIMLGPDKATCESSHKVCSKPAYTTKTTCQNNSGTWANATGTWTPANHNTWDGCVMDRGTNTAPGTNAGPDQTIALTPAWPAQSDTSSACVQKVTGLSYNWTTLKSNIDLMVANGNTNQPIGLVWGWQSLEGGGPFTKPPIDPNFDYQSYIILLSDGLNTYDRWSTNETTVDNRMYYKPGATAFGTCVNVKNAGTKVFTVQVNTGGDPTSTLLQNCASDPSYFFELKTSTGIDAAFQQIFNIISNLHLSQ